MKSHTLTLIVTQITQLTPRIRRYQLRSTNANELPLVTAGAHLEIRLTNEKNSFHSYAICSNPNQRDFYEIAVLHDEAQEGATQFMFNHLIVGTSIECSAPANNFHLHADASPAIFIAGGIGIAPMISMMHTLDLRGRRFSLHYAGRSRKTMAFLNELDTAFARHIHIYPADEHVRLDMMQILADAPGNTLFYASGPQKMLDDLHTCARLLGIASDRIQSEQFFIDGDNQDKAVVLELAYSDKLINARAEQPLLAALREANIDVNFDCCIGDCGTCAVKVLEGEADHRDHILSDEQKAQGFMCVCVSRAKSDKLVLAL